MNNKKSKKKSSNMETKTEKSFMKMEDALSETLKNILETKKKKGSIQSGFTELDNFIGNFQKTDLIVVGGRPSMGSTEFATTIARNVSIKNSIPVAFFSMNLSTIKLVKRMLSAESRTPLWNIFTGKINHEASVRLTRASHKLINKKMYFFDSRKQTMGQIYRNISNLKENYNIGLVIIDYLQLIEFHRKFEDKEQKIAAIVTSLKNISIEVGIPIIALSQLSRQVEFRRNKRPMLSDLYGSSTIEEIADVVLALYRPEVYGITVSQDGENTEGYAEVIIAKNRDGYIGSVMLDYLREYATFENRQFRFLD